MEARKLVQTVASTLPQCFSLLSTFSKFYIDFSVVTQVSDFPEEQLMVAVFPGIPTAAELFLLPRTNQSEGKKKCEEELEQVWASFGILTSHVSRIQIKTATTSCCMCFTGVGHNCQCAEPKFGGVRAQVRPEGDCVQHTVNTG